MRPAGRRPGCRLQAPGASRPTSAARPDVALGSCGCVSTDRVYPARADEPAPGPGQPGRASSAQAGAPAGASAGLDRERGPGTAARNRPCALCWKRWRSRTARPRRFLGRPRRHGGGSLPGLRLRARASPTATPALLAASAAIASAAIRGVGDDARTGDMARSSARTSASSVPSMAGRAHLDDGEADAGPPRGLGDEVRPGRLALSPRGSPRISRRVATVSSRIPAALPDGPGFDGPAQPRPQPHRPRR